MNDPGPPADNPEAELAGDSAIERLKSLMRRLRDPVAGCPWDRVQSFQTIAPYTIEEAYEVAEAIAQDDLAALKDELGDLLFQIFFLCRLASERGWFDVEEVASAIESKMISRHPHVFGGEAAPDAAAVKASWERRKRAAGERSPDPLEGIPASLPALSAALRMGARAADLGFDWERDTDLLGKVEEEIGEARRAASGGSSSATEEEIGDLFFAIANWARRLDIDPEKALRSANAKFRRRFARVAEKARAAGRDVSVCSPEELDQYWNETKAEEKAVSGSAPTRRPV